MLSHFDVKNVTNQVLTQQFSYVKQRTEYTVIKFIECLIQSHVSKNYDEICNKNLQQTSTTKHLISKSVQQLCRSISKICDPGDEMHYGSCSQTCFYHQELSGLLL